MGFKKSCGFTDALKKNAHDPNEQTIQGRIAKAFSSNNLVNIMEMTAAINILTAAQSLASQDYYKKVSNEDTWASWCIILRKRADIDTMDFRMFRGKYLLGRLGKLGAVSKLL